MQQENYIEIIGAKTHNLKNISIKIPKDKLIVFTGVSGSGKSSLAIDTIFAEGQRRYAESMNAYIRQFMNRMQKPDVEHIHFLSPAIAIDQRVSTNTNARSTVGTMTEIYDYLKILFARIGEIYSPKTNKKLQMHSVESVKNFIEEQPDGAKIFICIETTKLSKNNADLILNEYLKKGFARVFNDKNTLLIDDVLSKTVNINFKEKTYLLIDRLIKKNFNDDDLIRISNSLENAFFEGKDEIILILNDTNIHLFSKRLIEDGIQYEAPTINLFSFNNSFGACPKCEGHGVGYDVDMNLVFPNKNLSIIKGGIALWKDENMIYFLKELIDYADSIGIDIEKKLADFSENEWYILMNGAGKYRGVLNFIEVAERESYKTSYRVLLSKFKRKTECLNCKGSRLKPEALYVKINGKNINDLAKMPIINLNEWFKNIELNAFQSGVSKRILLEINNRLTTLLKVGLGYLTLNRNAATLSGGESQRIKLTLSLGSSLTESIYILDEPSIGLHSRDTNRLIEVLKELRDLGNTVMVVEHDESIMKAADHIIDIGPLASYKGGEVIFEGSFKQLLKNKKSITAQYLNKDLNIEKKKFEPNFKDAIKIKNANLHNIKNLSVDIPINCMTVVAGVSGSGKTTLVKHILYPFLNDYFYDYKQKEKNVESIQFNDNKIDAVEMIDQNAMSRNSRSNPISYIGGFEELRNIFQRAATSQKLGMLANMFSYNSAVGRCDKCEGEGYETISMQFLADVKVLCESCKGKRYKPEVLEVMYNNKNIADVLEMSIDESLDFFAKEKKIIPYLDALQKVGLGYIRLGQSSSTLSGGEAQRIKLATFLLKGNRNDSKILFIFDEPTTGLHFNDIQILLKAFEILIEMGHTLLVIEHNIEVIKNADHIIELGPDAGDNGGQLIFNGNLNELKKSKKSVTQEFVNT